jgi:hypothetical protein
MAAKQFLLQQKWASAAIILGLVLIFVLIAQLSNHRRKNQPRTD